MPFYPQTIDPKLSFMIKDPVLPKFQVCHLHVSSPFFKKISEITIKNKKHVIKLIAITINSFLVHSIVDAVATLSISSMCYHVPGLVECARDFSNS